MNTRAWLMVVLFFATPVPLDAQSPPPAASGATQPAQTTGGVIVETELDRQVKEVASQLRCVVCQGLSIQDSPSSLAQEMRGLVREQLAAGSSPDEVKAYFVERYGEWVLLRPAARGFNLIVYLLPVFMILAGAAFVFVKARQWTTGRPSSEAASEVEPRDSTAEV